MSNIGKYNEVFKSVFNVQEDVLKDNFSQPNVANWDSVTHLTLVTTLEEEFDIMFDTDDILNLNSYEMGKEILARLDVQF
jgi:acyl carrier protein